MKNHFLTLAILSIILFSCNSHSKETNIDNITQESGNLNSPDINWVTDENDIVIPDKRKNVFIADAFRMGLKGNVKKIEERHYSAQMIDEELVVSTNLVNTEIMFNDGPSDELYLICTNRDIYFDHDGFDVKSIFYNSDMTINSISYNYYDANGNQIKHISKNNEREKIDSEFRLYNEDRYLPWEKKQCVVESDGTVTRYYEYDSYGNVITETMKDNINGTYPFSIITRFLYEYDEEGNWISRTRLLKSCKDNLPFFPSGVARRTINYW